MLGISGLEVFSRVWAQTPAAPVPIIIAFGNVEKAFAALAAGVEDFTGKPFHREQLLPAIEKALARRRLTAEVRGGLETSFLLELLVYPTIYKDWKWESVENARVKQQEGSASCI